MNRIHITISICMITGIITCQKSLLRDISTSSIGTIWYMGGDAQRSGLSSEEISPPLKLLWTHKAHSALDQAIVASDSFLTFGTKDGWLTILNLQTGDKIREMKIKKQVSITSSFDKSCLYVAQRWATPSLCAYDFETGNIIWEKEKGPIMGEPMIFNNRLIAGNEQGNIFMLDSQNGDEIWIRDINESVSGYAFDSKDKLIVTTDRGTVYGISFADGQIIWRQTLAGSIAANPVLSDEKVLVGIREGNFYALSIDDGTIDWQFASKGSVFLGGATDQSHVYFGTTQGVVHCLDVQTGKEKWHFETNSVIGTSPLISGRWIYFGTLNKILFCISRVMGEVQWQFELKGRIRTSPLFHNGILVVASEDRYVYGFTEEN